MGTNLSGMPIPCAWHQVDTKKKMARWTFSVVGAKLTTFIYKRVALHNLTTPVMAVVAVAAVVVAVVVAGLGGLAPTAQNTQCVW